MGGTRLRTQRRVLREECQNYASSNTRTSSKGLPSCCDEFLQIKLGLAFARLQRALAKCDHRLVGLPKLRSKDEVSLPYKKYMHSDPRSGGLLPMIREDWCYKAPSSKRRSGHIPNRGQSTQLQCMCFFWLSGRPTLMPTYSWTGTIGAGLRACMQWVALRVANSATMQHRHEKCKHRSFFCCSLHREFVLFVF